MADRGTLRGAGAEVAGGRRLVAKHIAPTSGIKRSIGLAYHRAGQPHDIRAESHQVLAPELPFISESHLFREDIDLFMVRVAQGYGAALVEDSEIVGVDHDQAGIQVTDRLERVYKARYLVDASSFASIVTKTFALREHPTRLRTQSRSIFTHVDGLQAYDDLFSADELPGMKYRWHDGTLHHMFDGGWCWIIPFGNHCESRNSQASVGLTLDMRKYPVREGVRPEQEFHDIVTTFPSVARHLKDTVATRPYVGTGRLQYSSTRAVGNRFFVTPQASGAVDALYSRGLISTFEMTYTFAASLLAALRDNNFSPERFAGLDDLARRQLDLHDQMVCNAYRSLADFETWSAWLKVWLASKLFGDIWLLRTVLRYQSSRDRQHLEELDLAQPPFAEPLQHLVDGSSAVLAAAEAGRCSWADAAASINGALAQADWLPNRAYAWNNPAVHHGDFTPRHVMPLTIAWGKAIAPAWVRRGLFDFPVLPLARMTLANTMGRHPSTQGVVLNSAGDVQGGPEREVLGAHQT